MLCTNLQTTNIAAVEISNVSNWKISNISLEHTYARFRISNVEKAQKAKLLIRDENSDNLLIEKNFSINNSIEEITVYFDDNIYLESGNYYISVMDMNNNESSKYSVWMGKHTFYTSCNAYPNGIELQDSYISKDESYHVSVSINFKEYTADIADNQPVFLEYPTQSIGTVISVKCYDDYGCEENMIARVENQYLGTCSFNARANVLYERNPSHSENERVVADVEGIRYYSDYGIKNNNSYPTEIISYPKVSDTTEKILVWVESKNGSKSDVREIKIEQCSLSQDNFKFFAFPCKAEGIIQKDEYSDCIPKTIKTIVNSQEYSTDITSDGKFILNYPRQKNDSEMTFIVEDQHGCQITNKRKVFNSEDRRENNIATLCNRAYDDVNKNVRIAIQIKDKIYYSNYAKSDDEIVSISYPKQKAGQNIKVWYEHINTSKSVEFNTTIYNREYDFSANVRTSSLTGAIETEGENKNYNIFAKVNGKEYPCLFMNKGRTKFSCKYPKQKIGAKVQLIVRDSDGYEYIEQFTTKNIKPKLKINNVYSSDTRLTGKTVAKSSITVKIGKKKYKGKAKSNGKFSIKIKTYRAGTKCKISIETPEGYYTSKNIRVSKVYGYAELSSEIYKSSTKAKLKIVGGRKGDKIKLKIGSKTYTKKVTSNKNYQKASLKIKKHAAGSKIKITLTDKFGKKKSTETDMVYNGTSIYIGMSAKEALLTTWGSPTSKNDWGSFDQWVFESGKSILYVYIEGGKITAMQRFNY